MKNDELSLPLAIFFLLIHARLVHVSCCCLKIRRCYSVRIVERVLLEKNIWKDIYQAVS